MYENVCKLMARQHVALEVLSYHASATEREAEKLLVGISPCLFPVLGWVAHLDIFILFTWGVFYN